MTWVRVPPRQLIFLRISDVLPWVCCVALNCLVVCLTLLASFFFHSHLSLKHVDVYYTQEECAQIMRVHGKMHCTCSRPASSHSMKILLTQNGEHHNLAGFRKKKA